MTGSRVKVGAWFVAEDRDDAFDGSVKVDNPLRERTRIKVPLVTLDVRITDAFGVQVAASVPDVTRTAIVPGATGTFDFKETFRGLGDTAAIGWYRLPPVRQWSVVLNLGVSLPTGKTERPRFRDERQDGSLVPTSRLQRGTGTFDPIVGLSVARRFRPVMVFGSLAARAPLTENGDGLRTGASWETNAGLAREVGSHRVTALARVGWLHRQQDAFRGTPVLVGGGDWLYVTPGVAVQVGRGVTVQAEVKLPVYRALANTQLDSRAIVQVGVSRAF